MGNLRNLPFELIGTRLDVLEAAGWTVEDLERLNKSRSREALGVLRGTMTPMEERGMSTNAQIGRIIAWYMKYTGKNLLVEAIEQALPERQPGFDRLIVVASEMTHNRCYATLEKQFGAESMCSYIENLANTVTSVRKTKKLYAVWCRNQKEADKENRNETANHFKQNKCLTLEERLIFEGLYFAETGEHLDGKCYTICAGSRDHDGRVPGVSWDPADRRVRVHWCYADNRYSDSAVRSAVS